MVVFVQVPKFFFLTKKDRCLEDTKSTLILDKVLYTERVKSMVSPMILSRENEKDKKDMKDGRNMKEHRDLTRFEQG